MHNVLEMKKNHVYLLMGRPQDNSMRLCVNFYWLIKIHSGYYVNIVAIFYSRKPVTIEFPECKYNLNII
jgi:hypothetical protein